MRTEIKPYNPFDFLLDDSDIGEYLTNAFMDDDPDLFIIALGHVARHKGFANLAKETGLNRESLYKALGAEGNPEFATVLKVLQALGLKLSIKSQGAAA